MTPWLPCRVLILEPQGLLRDLLAQAIAQNPQFELAGTFGDAEEAMQGGAALSPRLIVMDVHFPDGRGLEAASFFLTHLPFSRVLVLSESVDAKMTDGIDGNPRSRMR